MRIGVHVSALKGSSRRPLGVVSEPSQLFFRKILKNEENTLKSKEEK